LISIFFAICIGVHDYEIYKEEPPQYLWHFYYFACYGVCWKMIFSSHKHRQWIYLIMAVFPFSTHLYYGYQHILKLDFEFWICLIVCLLLPIGFFVMKKESK
jgi:hypothetical protein